MLALGIASTRELEARCTIQDLDNWLEFYTVEPYGDARADDRARAIILKVHETVPYKEKTRLHGADVLPTPWALYQAEIDRRDPIKQAEKAKRVAIEIAAWLGVRLGDDTEWQLQ